MAELAGRMGPACVLPPWTPSVIQACLTGGLPWEEPPLSPCGLGWACLAFPAA